MLTFMLESTTLYIFELLKVFLSCIYISKISIKHKTYALISILLSIFVVFSVSYFIDISTSGIPFAIVSIALMITFMKDTKKCGLVFLNYILCSMVDIALCYIVMLLFCLNANTITDNAALHLFANSLSLFPLTIFILISQKKGKSIPTYHISGKLILLLTIGAFTLAMNIAAFEVFVLNDNTNSYSVMIGLCITLSSFIFIFIVVLLLFKQSKNGHLKQQAEINLKLLNSQENYYTMLLEKDNETHAFRHDIQHHIYTMHILLRNKDYNALEEYLSQLDDSIQELKPTLHTGNNLVNAIALDISSGFKDVKLNWTGRLPDPLAISSMDLCTIFSNLLTNAFEASSQTDAKNVDVSIKALEANLLITITNPAPANLTFVRGVFLTTKPDQGHGYGLKNVQKCVDKNHGIFKAFYNNEIFTAEVILPVL